MSAREAILASIRAKRPSTFNTMEARPVQAPIRPAYTHLTASALYSLFLDKLSVSGATYTQIHSLKEVPDATERYLGSIGYDFPIRLCPALREQSLAWSRETSAGTAREQDRISVTRAPYGIAETGTLVCLSCDETPTTLNFMAEVNIIILESKNIVANYEDAWQKLVDKQEIPRTVNLITGPSRTADIAQTLLLGVHGPRLLHVLIINTEKHPG